MSLFSSILGGQGATPIGNPQQITTTEIPKQLAPYYTDILGKAQALYNKRVEEGYKPYEGPTIAQYTPEQEATFAGIAGLQGQVAPKFAEAEQMTRDAAGAITGAEIQEAMSPYQQAVTDIEKRQAQKSYEQNVLPKVRAAQIAQGSFGGTRGTLLEAQSLGDQQQVLADIQAKGSAAAFKDARAALDAQRLRQGQGATQLANLAPAALSNQLKELGAQQTVGETKQRQAQTALDEAYRQFQLEKQEPYDAMSKYQSVVTGAPLGSTQYAPPAPPGPSLGQTLIGGAGTAAGLYGAFTGQNPLAAVGLMGKKEGGGLSDLPVIKRAESGSLSSNLLKGADRFIVSPFKRTVDDIYDIGTLNIFDRPFGTERASDLAREKNRKNMSEVYRLANMSPEEVKKEEFKKSMIRDPEGGIYRPTGKITEVNKLGEVGGIQQLKKEKEAGLKPKPRPSKVSGPEQGPPIKPPIEKAKPSQGPNLPKGGLRELAMQQQEEKIKKLYGQYKQQGETDLAESKDAQFRSQMANMAQAFAQFATRGGEGNILQKAIATTGDNIDRFIGTSDKFRKEKKAIEANLQKGELEEAKLGLDVARDRADREIRQEDRELAALKEKDTKAYRDKVFKMEKKKQEDDLKYKYDALQAEIKAAEAKGVIKSADITALNKIIQDATGMTYGKGPNNTMILQGKAFNAETQAKINDIAALGQQLLSRVGPDIYYRELHKQNVVDPLNNLIQKDSKTSEGDSNTGTGLAADTLYDKETQ